MLVLINLFQLFIIMIEDFQKLKICEEILKVIEKEGFEAPTSIQNKAIPYILERYDVMVKAATGSGKTLTYAVRLIQNSEKGKGVQGLVIVPTRELAKQVGDVLNRFSEYKPLKIVVSYGGGSLNDQKNNFSDIDILVATSGRVKQLITEDILQFSNLQTLVLDEVDSMFVGQFEEDMDFILRNTPHRKQTMVFSATISKEIYMKVKHWMKNPKRIEADLQISPKKLKQVYYDVEPNQKLSLLSYLLKVEKAGLIMVFVNRQDTAEFLSKNLKQTGLEVEVIHGDMIQGKRNRIIKDFHEQKFDVLIATDMVARGIDMDAVSHIYNYNIPKFSDKYIHRIGRTARAGHEGKVINFISKVDQESFIHILQEYKISMQRKDLPKFEEVAIKKKLVKKKYKVKF